MMDNINVIKEEIKKLKNSPVYAMSLGSKELFHSNFWAWIMEQKFGKEFIQFFFNDFQADKYIVMRENKNRDIVIKADCAEGSVEYIIENKLKSIPVQEQLIRYKCNKGILTGINPPVFELPENWRFVKYEDICKKLRTLEIEDNFFRCVVSEYCDNLDAIQKVLNFSLEEDKGQLNYSPSVIDDLKSIRIHDIFKKIKALDFIEENNAYFQKRYCKKTRDWEYYHSLGYNNGKATISFGFYKKVKTEENVDFENLIGVQIEEDQFRLFLKLANYKNDNAFEKGNDLGWFEKYGNKTFLEIPTKMTKTYCKYGDDWIYQYFTIDKNFQSYERLKEKIEDNLDRAKIIIEKL